MKTLLIFFLSMSLHQNSHAMTGSMRQNCNGLSSLEIFQGWEPLSLAKSFVYNDPKWTETKGVIEMGIKSESIRTIETYDNFEFKFQWKSRDPGSAAIILTSPKDPVNAWKHGFKYFLRTGDPKDLLGINNKSPGSCFDLSSTGKIVLKKLNQWNTAKIIKQGNYYQFFLNGVKSANFYSDSNKIKNSIKSSTIYSLYPNLGIRSKGHIVIESHGDAFQFKDLKIRRIRCFINCIPEPAVY